MKIHFISTGRQFPYSYYLGVMTALKAFKDDVVLTIVGKPESIYFDLLKKKKSLKINYFGRLSTSLASVLKNLTEHELNVAVFDFLAWNILSMEGGIIAGLDSLTIERWDNLLPPNKEMLVPRDSDKVEDSYAMHGVAVKRHSKIAKDIFNDICLVLRGKEPGGRHKSLENGKLKWGGLGIIPYLNNVYKNIDKVAIVKPGILGDTRLINGLFSSNLLLNKVQTKTIPLYATSNKNFKKITPEYVNTTNDLYGRLVRKILSKTEYDPFSKIKASKHKFCFHLLGLVHVPISERYMACAFTQKIVKLSKMLLSLGHEVYLYGAEGSDAPCTRCFQTHSLKDIRDAWGEGDNRFEIGYNWQAKNFKHDFNAPRTPTTLKYYANCIRFINSFKKPDNFLLLTQGMYQKPIQKAVNLWLTCEPGIGYRGSYVRFRAFESAYLQNFTYGSEHPRQSVNGHYYDRVIPNYFDANDFPFNEKASDYYLYMGRMAARKGVFTAVKTVEAIGGKLKIAGQKSDIMPKNTFCEFVGYADPKKRAKLMGNAIATFVPTLYLEAFGGVAVESMLCGTPAITTDFGVFPETVKNGISGYRCNTLNDFVKAAKIVGELDRKAVRAYAERYLMRNVKKEFQKWFTDLYQLYLSAHNPNIKGWHYLEKPC